MSAPFAYREEYLQALVAELRPRFGAIGVELPAVRCSCSFAYRGGHRVLGQCWPGTMAADGMAQIKITPLRDDAVDVAGILVHELIHAARPGAGHRKPFRDIALPVGLIGQMRSTVPGPALTRHLIDLTARLGPYPHARLDPDVCLTERHRSRSRLVRVSGSPAVGVDGAAGDGKRCAVGGRA